MPARGTRRRHPAARRRHPALAVMTGHSTDERAAPTTSPVRSIRRLAVTRKGSRQLVVVAPPARPMPGVRPATSRLSRRFGSTMRRRWWIDVFFVNPHPLLKVERDTLRFPAGTTLGNLRKIQIYRFSRVAPKALVVVAPGRRRPRRPGSDHRRLPRPWHQTHWRLVGGPVGAGSVVRFVSSARGGRFVSSWLKGPWPSNVR